MQERKWEIPNDRQLCHQHRWLRAQDKLINRAINTTFLSIFNSSVHAAKIAVCRHTKCSDTYSPWILLMLTATMSIKMLKTNRSEKFKFQTLRWSNLRHKVEVKGLALEFNTLAANIGPGEWLSYSELCFFRAILSGCRNPVDKTFGQVWATQSRDL